MWQYMEYMAFFVVGIYGNIPTSIQLWHCFREQLRNPSMTQISRPQNQPGGKIHGPVWLGSRPPPGGVISSKKNTNKFMAPQKNDPKTDEFINTENTSVVPKIDSLILRRAN